MIRWSLTIATSASFANVVLTTRVNWFLYLDPNTRSIKSYTARSWAFGLENGRKRSKPGKWAKNSRSKSSSSRKWSTYWLPKPLERSKVSSAKRCHFELTCSRLIRTSLAVERLSNILHFWTFFAPSDSAYLKIWPIGANWKLGTAKIPTASFSYWIVNSYRRSKILYNNGLKRA